MNDVIAGAAVNFNMVFPIMNAVVTCAAVDCAIGAVAVNIIGIRAGTDRDVGGRIFNMVTAVESSDGCVIGRVLDRKVACLAREVTEKHVAARVAWIFNAGNCDLANIRRQSLRKERRVVRQFFNINFPVIFYADCEFRRTFPDERGQ